MVATLERTGITSGVELVTPAKAEAWLGVFIHNRALRKRKLNQYKSDLIGDRWVVGTDAIGFDTNGRCNNGYHRLTAIKETGIAAECLVVRGLSPEAVGAIDIGAARSGGDVFGMTEGVTSGNRVLAIIRAVMSYECGAGAAFGRNTPADTSIPAARQRYRMDSDGFDDASDFAGHCNLPGVPPAVVGGVYYLARDKMAASDFFHAVRSGDGIEKGNAAFTLRGILFSAAARHRKRHPRWAAAVVVKALNAYTQGKQLLSVGWTPASPFPELKA